MQQGNRPLVVTLEVLALHRTFEAQGLLKDDAPSESSDQKTPR